MGKKVLAVAALVAASLAGVGAKADVCVHTYVNGNVSNNCAPTGGFVNLYVAVDHKTFYDGVAVKPTATSAPYDGVAVRYPVGSTSTGGDGAAVWLNGQMTCLTAPPGSVGPVTLNGTCPIYPSD